MLHAARRAITPQSLIRSHIRRSINQSIISSTHQRHFTETSEERAKRMSDEADAEFRASGKQAKLRTKRPVEQSTNQTDNQSSSTDSQSASQTSETTTESSNTQSDSQSTKTSPVKGRNWFTSLTNEWSHLQQFMAKFQKPVKEKSKRDIAAVLSNENPFVPVTRSPLEEAKEGMKSDEDELNLNIEEEYKGPSGLVLVDSSTVWDKRLERMRDSFASSSAFLTFRKAKRTLVHSDNPILKPIQQVSSSVNETLEDIRLTWETSQHPALFKVRNITDKVVGENEQGFAIGEIMKIDPSFDLLDFLDEMEHYMIPAVITAYLRGNGRDQKMLQGLAADTARSAFWSSIRARDAAMVQWDSTILDLSGVELANAQMINDEPFLTVSFVVQQVKCVRKKPGYNAAKHKEEMERAKQAGAPQSAPAAVSDDPDVVEGHPSQIVSVYYQFMVQRDFENPDFDWRIVQFVSHEMFHLSA